MKLSGTRYTINGKGFTLLEILIAIFILATVLSTVFASYTGTFRIVDETESQAEIYRMARIALGRIIEDLESFHVPRKADTKLESEDLVEALEFSGQDNEIYGRSADTLRFPSRAHLVFGREDQRWPTIEITYYVEEDEDGEAFILYRSDRPQLAELSEESRQGFPLCKRLVSVDFAYHDAKGEEHDNWDSSYQEGTPKRVSISLEFINPSDPEASIRFATSVVLPASGTDKEEDKSW